MAYPQPANWRSGVPLAAWYAENVAGRDVRACQTSGWGFLRDLQETLQTRLSDSAKPTIGGMIDGSAILINDIGTPADQGWNATLLRALYAVAQADHAPTAYLQAIAADLAAGRVSIPTLQTAIWITYLNEGQRGTGSVYGLGSPAEAMIREDSLLPEWNVPPARPTNGVVSSGLSCFVAPDALHAAPGPTWTSFLGNPCVIIGAAALGVAAIMVASHKIPRTSRRAPEASA